jgi:hypothetical protein
MAVLQAARGQALGLTHDSALSWGLNRAIFYAAAKQGFREAPRQAGEGAGTSAGAPSPEFYQVGDDGGFRSPTAKGIVFTIGGEDQTVERFDKQVAARFGTKENFQAAWDEAIRIVGSVDRATLASRQRFYEEVYKPRRDELSDGWTQKYSPLPKGQRRAG